MLAKSHPCHGFQAQTTRACIHTAHGASWKWVSRACHWAAPFLLRVHGCCVLMTGCRVPARGMRDATAVGCLALFPDMRAAGQGEGLEGQSGAAGSQGRCVRHCTADCGAVCTRGHSRLPLAAHIWWS